MEEENLVKLDRLTQDDILRYYRPQEAIPSKPEKDLLTFIAELAKNVTPVFQETGSRALSLLGQYLAVELEKVMPYALKSLGCYDIGLRVVGATLSAGLGQQFDSWAGGILKDVEASLQRRRAIREQILTDAKRGCESLGSVELVDNNLTLAAYHFLARGDETWLKDNRFQVLELAHTGPPCRALECPRCAHQITLQEWDTRKFICPEHEVFLVVSPSLPLPKPPLNLTALYQEQESVIPIEHVALEYASRGSLSLRIPKMLPFSELVIATAEMASMLTLRRFLQDFLRTSPLRGEVRQNEECLRQSYARLLQTLRSAPAINAG